MSYCPNYNPNGNLSRQQRLAIGERRILFHQTDTESAYSILSSGKFKCGSSGVAGAGIYFATTECDTNHKAHKKGIVIKCMVKLGNVQTINKKKKISAHSLSQSGYDSICIRRQSGKEYVVYNTDQIQILSNNSSKHKHLGMITSKHGTYYHCDCCHGVLQQGLIINNARVCNSCLSTYFDSKNAVVNMME
eukprot:258555_1